MGKSDAARERRSFLKWCFIWTENRRVNRLAFIFFWSILMYYFIRAYVVSVGVVVDISMYPTLPEGGYYLVNKYIHHFTPPERGEIVVLRRNANASEQYVKRVIGLSGETITIRSGRVYINGRQLVEPYAVGLTFPDFGPYRIGKDAYFVLGDNRQVSEDSRHFGSVPVKNILGKIKPETFFPFQ